MDVGQLQCMAGGLVLLVGVLAGGGLPTVLVGLFVAISSLGLITSNGTALGMRAAPGGAGAAAGVLGIAQFAVGGSLAPLGGLAASALPMALLVCGCAVLAPVARWSLLRRRG
jgi:DHA1 family bicyclomycin/chloramphenicol resistance-like MFS transporter